MIEEKTIEAMEEVIDALTKAVDMRGHPLSANFLAMRGCIQRDHLRAEGVEGLLTAYMSGASMMLKLAADKDSERFANAVDEVRSWAEWHALHQPVAGSA